MNDLIEIKGTDYGIKVTFCTNAETLCSGSELENWQEEATADAIDDGQRKLYEVADTCVAGDTEGCYTAWNGGWCAQCSMSSTGVVAKFYRRTVEFAEDDVDHEYPMEDWEYVVHLIHREPNPVPDPIVKQVQGWLDRIGDVIQATLERWEKDESEAQARYAREDAESEVTR